jgi:ubiquinone/menaquinone biosynthesis C-methylase UbiE
MPGFASLEDVLRYFLFEEPGAILDAGADALETSLVFKNSSTVVIDRSKFALNERKMKGFPGEVILASITALPFRSNAFVKCICSKGLEALSNTSEVTNAILELSRACKTTIVTLRRYTESVVHRVLFTRVFVDRAVKGVGIHYGILRREDGDFVIYLLSRGMQSPKPFAMEYSGVSTQDARRMGRVRAKRLE